MAKLYISYQSGLASGSIQVTIRRLSDMYIRYSVGPVFEANNDAHVASYGITLADQGGDVYSVNMPSDVAAGSYLVTGYYVPGLTLQTNSVIISDPLQIQWSGTAVTGSPSVAANQATVGSLQTILQVSARNAGINSTFNNDPYSAVEADLAIQNSLSHFLRETKCVQKTSTADLPISTNAIDLSAITGWHSERIIRAWLVPTDATKTVCHTMLDVVEYEEIIEHRERNICTATPRRIAFATDQVSAITDNTADQEYTLSLKWWPPISSWTAGDSGATGTVINIPADMANEVVRTYGVVLLQRSQPQQQKEGVIANLKAQYDAYVNAHRGAGNMGVRSIRRKSISEIRRERQWRW